MRVLVSEGPVIATRSIGVPIRFANAVNMAPADPEYPHCRLSLTYGEFKFASLGDLDWQRDGLASVNKLGSVTLTPSSPRRLDIRLTALLSRSGAIRRDNGHSIAWPQRRPLPSISFRRDAGAG